MIITCLRGGLGNQMFQYALGRYLAEKHNTELLLDTTRYLEDEKRRYALGAFCIHARIANLDEVSVFNEKNKYKRAYEKIGRFFFGRYIQKIREKSLKFDPEILKSKDNVYLLGYWQSEKYFLTISQLLRKEFQLKRELIKDEKNICNMISKEKNSVSLHVRRGDYITDLNANKYHGVCSLQYYEDAVEYLKKRIGNLKLFVFSDDLKWVKENLKLEASMEFVNYENIDDGQGEMYLMSVCDHHIIANSSFSWWGAWLNCRANKIVIAPKQWMNISKEEYESILPDAWIRL